jgi:hypothetical protein
VRRPKMTSIDKCPHERRSRGGSFGPATGLAVLPPRSGFRRLFAHRCSRMVELDLMVGKGFYPLQSARGLAPPVDFCNRIAPRARPRTIRTPRTASAVAHRRSSVRGWLQLKCFLSVALRTRPTELSRARDRVSAVTRLRRPDASLRNRSRRELRPAPLGSDTSRCEPVARRIGAIPPHSHAVTGVRCELAMTKERV